ncbi:protein translocase subunit SecF [Flindersiella endophytica]
MSRLGRLGHKLYTGEASYNFVGKKRLWYAISAAIIVIAIGAIAVRGLNFSIEFRGGVDFTAPVPASVGTGKSVIPDVRTAVENTGTTESAEPIVTAIGNDRVRIEAPPLSVDETSQVRKAIADQLGINETQVNYSAIGPTWGGQITQRALVGLGVFLVLVMIVIWLYFREWRMSVSGLVALAHDLLITVGIYALVGFEVTPATIIGVLTILGYSLYDTVVVFDKVRENTNGISATSRRTYSEAANLALNQTLVRSINTSVIALLPVAGILFVGAGLLGAGTLKDLALALFIGIAAGTYSSIFIATPFLCSLKEREPAMQALSRRVEQRRTSEANKAAAVAGDDELAEPVAAKASNGTSGAGSDAPSDAKVSTGAAARRSAPGPGGRSQPQRKSRSSRRPKGRR